jgi:hypothetical protein
MKAEEFLLHHNPEAIIKDAERRIHIDGSGIGEADDDLYELIDSETEGLLLEGPDYCIVSIDGDAVYLCDVDGPWMVKLREEADCA